MKMSIHIKLVIIAWFAVASTVTFTSSVQAACDPKIASIAADPYTISKSSPTTKIIVEVSGVDTCIRGSLNGVEVYAEAIGTSSKLATWSLGLFVESNPGQPIYRLERIPNVFTEVSGSSEWKTIKVHAGIKRDNQERDNDSIITQLNNTSGTKDIYNPNLNTNQNTNNSNTNNKNTNQSNTPTNTGININSTPNWDESIGSFVNPLNVESIPQLITKIINILLSLIAMAAVIVIIISGFRMVIDAGNEDQVKKAKKAITWAIIGLVVALMSFSIVAILQSLITRSA